MRDCNCCSFCPACLLFIRVQNHAVKCLLMTCLGRHRGGGCNPFPTWHYRDVCGQNHAPTDLPATHCTRGWVGLGAGLEGVENLAPLGIRSQDGLARIESLCRLCYPGHHKIIYAALKFKYPNCLRHAYKVILS